MDGAPVSLAQGQLIEAGEVPGGITVQIISDSTAMQVSQPATATVLNNVDVPGVAETLLNISQPEGYITSDQVRPNKKIPGAVLRVTQPFSDFVTCASCIFCA